MTAPQDWTFADFGPRFDEHVRAHLPGYEAVQALAALVAEYALPDGGVLADYGASTGTTIREILDRVPGREIDAYLYDADASMLDIAAERVPGAHLECARLPLGAPPERPEADLTLALWFLQFIPYRLQDQVLSELRAGAREGGVLLLATKTLEQDFPWWEIASGFLDDWKASSGVTPEEREEKTRRLRGAMFPAVLPSLRSSLSVAGWGSVSELYRLPGWALLGAVAE